MKPRAAVVMSIACAVFASIALGCISSCSKDGDSTDAVPLTIAAVPTELNTLLYVAEDRGLFKKHGLEMIFKDYDSGAGSLIGILNGEADIALTAEFPIVVQVFAGKEVLNFGTIARYENTYIIWRKDSGIEKIQNLKGKSIGVTLTTISEFYLGRTLELHGLSVRQVTLIDMKAADAEKALLGKEVDAVVTWEPWVEYIRQDMGDNVIIREGQSEQYAFWNMVATGNWVSGNIGIIQRLIESLAEADDYVIHNEGNTKDIVAKRMGFDEAYMNTLWPHYQFLLSLDQSLITAMEDEARWMIENDLTSQVEVPDFGDYIYENVLREIKPDAVNIIR